MIYYKINMTHPSIDGVLVALEKGFKQVRPKNRLSVNKNIAGTEAWVKLINDVDLSAFPNAILDKALLFKQHREKVIPDVSSPAWQIE